jgi:hypothetical protein
VFVEVEYGDLNISHVHCSVVVDVGIGVPARAAQQILATLPVIPNIKLKSPGKE